MLNYCYIRYRRLNIFFNFYQWQIILTYVYLIWLFEMIEYEDVNWNNYCGG